MLFEANSVIFVLLTALIFFILHGRARLYCLLAASVLYMLWLSPTAAAAAVLISVITFFTGKRIGDAAADGRGRAARGLLAAAVIAYCILLLFYKFFPLAYEAFIPQPEGADAGGILSWIVIPVGLSFYLFQAISYLADIYMQKYTPNPDPVSFLVYMLFFGKFISGPIEREADFYDELANAQRVRFFDISRLTSVLMYVLYGCLLKVVIADRIAIYADQLFSSCIAYSTSWLIIGSLLYTLQLYCDFAGYSYMVTGIALLFGIRLSVNFDSPYCSENITEFWRRWHITLGSWFRDYVYIPLGGNRRGFARKLLNLAVVFILCGIWHGSGLTFVIWGALHALYSVLDNLAAKNGFLSRLRRGIAGRIFTFCAASFAWIFFRADDMKHLADYLGTMINAGFRPHSFIAEFYSLEMSRPELYVTAAGVIFIILCDIISYIKKKSLPELLSGIPFAGKCAFVYMALGCILVLGVYGIGYDGTQLIYMQF